MKNYQFADGCVKQYGGKGGLFRMFNRSPRTNVTQARLANQAQTKIAQARQAAKRQFQRLPPNMQQQMLAQKQMLRQAGQDALMNTTMGLAQAGQQTLQNVAQGVTLAGQHALQGLTQAGQNALVSQFGLPPQVVSPQAVQQVVPVSPQVEQQVVPVPQVQAQPLPQPDLAQLQLIQQQLLQQQLQVQKAIQQKMQQIGGAEKNLHKWLNDIERYQK